ncbi:cyanophycin synthetase [Flavitalea sp.]|nr:cyanophycin synthetase [Flavitalea sp.]
MKVLEIRATEGPNYWSVKREQLVVMLLDLEEMEHKPTNLIPGFFTRLQNLMPSLYEHRCSRGVPGGFLFRVKEGTWMGHVMEHVALELQTMAGLKASFGQTRGIGEPGKYHVVFEYDEINAGKYAAEAAFRITSALIDDTSTLIDDLNFDIRAEVEAIRAIACKNKLGPSTSSLVAEAKRRNIPVIRLDDNALIQFGYGAAQRRIEATLASTTCSIAVDLAGCKAATKNILRSGYIPVPEGRKFSSEEELKEICEELGFPLVIKPVDGNQGNGATTDIRNFDEASAAFKIAKGFSSNLICEKFIIGSDFRILIINFKFEAAALRTPARITGDDIHTINELISVANEDPDRGDGHENSLTKISIDEVTLNFLKHQQLDLSTVLPIMQEVFLKPTANLSTGGTAEDVTELVHPDNIKLFERVARIMNLDICGIDVIAPSLAEPITDNGGSIIEVNAAPGFRMHLNPTIGKRRNVAKPVLDMLFPDDNNGRIPIIAITGTNGKTTTTRLIAHITKQAGYRVGFTTTDGIYIDDQMILKGDCTGPVSSKAVLKDSYVNMAVLECARGGILRGGLGFDQCDIGIVTNIASDHLGMGGIDCLEKLARVKATVVESVKPGGYAILNADDDLVFAMLENLRCNIALFSMNPDSQRIADHIHRGGMAAIYENDFITILNGKMRFRIGRVSQMPITFSGAATFNIANVLAASLATFIQKIHPRDIFGALLSFIPCPETIPGRMNVFEFHDHKVIVDYAHNPHSVQAIASFINSLPATRKIGVITGVGDRRKQDIKAIGTEAAKIFDEIIIRHDDDMRGLSKTELDSLISEGIKEVDPSKKITIIDSELQAVEEVLKNHISGSVSVILTDNIKAVVTKLKGVMIKRDMNHEEERYEL